jgi:hypothetical protein
MALARVVAFDDVDAARMQQLNTEIESSGRPEGVPATEILVLHDVDAGKALAILFFDTEEDYAQGDAALNAMAADDTPGRRSSVTRYMVAARASASA